MPEKPLRELRKCRGCPRYFWTVVQPLQEDNLAERLRYCKECWEHRIQKPMTLSEIERENTELTEEEKQAEEAREQFQRRRFSAS